MAMRFARLSFVIAAVYGLLALIPGLLIENTGGHAFLAQPEYYYGFYGSALVWQFAFLLIASDPVRYRPLMLVAALEKAAFFLPSMLLWNAGRLAGGSGPFIGAIIDGMLLLLFVAAWWSTPKTSLPGETPVNKLATDSNPS